MITIEPKEYLKKYLPSDIFNIYLNIKEKGLLYYYYDKKTNKKELFTDIFLFYYYDKKGFIELLKKIFGDGIEFHIQSNNWSSISIVINNSIDGTIYICISGFTQYYRINKFGLGGEKILNNEEQIYINKFKNYINSVSYKDYGNEKLDFITLDIEKYNFLTKDEFISLCKKEYKDYLKESGENYYSQSMRNGDIKGNRKYDFEGFMIDELNGGDFLDIPHLLFYGIDMF